MRSKPLGQLLVENGDVSNEQVAQAVKTQETNGGMIGGILLGMGVCTPDAISHALAKQVQVTDIQCEELEGSAAAVKLVSREICNREKLCPFEVLGNMLCVVMGNPLNRKAISEIENSSRMKVKAFKAPWPKINELIERSYALSFNASKSSPAIAPAKHDAPLEDLSFELDDEPVMPMAKTRTNTPAPGTVPPPTKAIPPVHSESLALDDDDIIIPASEPDYDDQPAGPTGILEILDDTIPLPSHSASSFENKVVQSPPPPTIKGLDALDFSAGELVDIAKRKANPGVKQIPKRKEPRIAQVNVDLDKFDQSAAGEVIETYQQPESGAMEEIQYGDMSSSDARKSDAVLVALKIVPDSYFYAGNPPKNAPRSDDLMDIIEALPVAEVVAESIADFERKKGGGTLTSGAPDSGVMSLSGTAMAGKSRVDLQRAPATPMAAIRLGEGEFQKLTLQMIEDEGGEWEWNFASTGPILVDAFED